METNLLQYPFSVVRYFIPEFISRMRKSGEVDEKPSPRQGIAMCDLLLPAYMRKGKLSTQDIVDAAVHTSRVGNQNIAERIALEVLLDVEEPEDEVTDSKMEDFLGLISQRSDDLVSYLSSDQDKPGQGDVRLVHDSDVDLFKELTSQPDLGVGPGEDELVKRVLRRNKDRRDERYRRFLAEFLKARLMKLGKDFEISTEELRRHIHRPYEQGDDPEDIDEERSLENIFDQGKRMEDVRYDDFFIRKKTKKRKAIVYILDISNTMFYQSGGLTSIHYSVMSLVPLLWSLRHERYGLVLYESNSHVQKNLYEERDIEELIDNLLILVTSTTSDVEKILRGTKGSRTWGGTVPNQSLKWALDQLEAAGERNDKICFYFSDFVLEDPGVTSEERMEIYSVLERLVDLGIHVVAGVSPLAKDDVFYHYTENVLKLVKRAGAEMIETIRPSNFLNSVEALLGTI